MHKQTGPAPFAGEVLELERHHNPVADSVTALSLLM